MDEFSFVSEGRNAGRKALLVYYAVSSVVWAALMIRSIDGAFMRFWACVVAPVALAWLFRPLFFVETVSCAGDEIVFRLRFLGVPFDRPRRARKSTVSRVAMDRRWIRDRPKESSREVWSVTLHSSVDPALTTVLPMSERDADALYSFLQRALGRA